MHAVGDAQSKLIDCTERRSLDRSKEVKGPGQGRHERLLCRAKPMPRSDSSAGDGMLLYFCTWGRGEKEKCLDQINIAQTNGVTELQSLQDP